MDCTAHLVDYDYDYAPNIDPGLLPPPVVEQLLPSVPADHVHHVHGHHKRQTVEDMGNDGDEQAIKISEDIEKTETDESELTAYNETGADTADLYSGLGCNPLYPCSQGSLNPLYTNSKLFNAPYPNPSGLGNSYPTSQYPILARYGNTLRYPAYPYRNGQYH